MVSDRFGPYILVWLYHISQSLSTKHSTYTKPCFSCIQTFYSLSKWAQSWKPAWTSSTDQEHFNAMFIMKICPFYPKKYKKSFCHHHPIIHLALLSFLLAPQEVTMDACVKSMNVMTTGEIWHCCRDINQNNASLIASTLQILSLQ